MAAIGSAPRLAGSSFCRMLLPAGGRGGCRGGVCRLPAGERDWCRLSTQQNQVQDASMEIGSKRARLQRREILKQNRQNPAMERAARTGKLLVPLNKVHGHWREDFGWKHLQTAGLHCNIYGDIFGSLFQPRGFLKVTYGNGRTVHRGNIITAAEAASPPEVTLPLGLPADHLCTLVLSNPDGHLLSNTKELLHWMICNIQAPDIASGRTECSYLPPIPPRGTGLHRFVFALYTHSKPIDDTGLSQEGAWLDKRTLSSQALLSTIPDLQPYTFSFFQCQWDKTVHHTFMERLGCYEPVYDLETKPNPRKLKQLAVREKRANRYRNM